MANILMEFGKLETELKSYDKASGMFHRAKGIYYRYGMKNNESIALEHLAKIYEENKNEQKTILYYKDALLLKKEALGEDHPETIRLKNKVSEFDGDETELKEN